jgi:SAM-dependent methyltransferase
MRSRLPRAVSKFAGLLIAIGINPRQTWLLRRLPRFLGEARAYRRRARRGPFPLRWSEVHPVLSEYAGEAGVVRGQYFHQDLWAARRIFERRPATHIDVGSRIDGFVAHVLSFMPVTIVDIRPLTSAVKGLRFVRADACELTDFATGSVDSLSSLHAVEHIGLGRYGDEIDPDGCFKAMRELARVLAPGGRLYFGVPVGRPRVRFNCERIFDPCMILDTFSSLELVDLKAVGDDEELIEAPRVVDLARADCACGLFEFTKR